jgi:hypothetical protein
LQLANLLRVDALQPPAFGRNLCVCSRSAAALLIRQRCLGFLKGALGSSQLLGVSLSLKADALGLCASTHCLLLIRNSQLALFGALICLLVMQSRSGYAELRAESFGLRNCLCVRCQHRLVAMSQPTLGGGLRLRGIPLAPLNLERGRERRRF